MGKRRGRRTRSRDGGYRGRRYEGGPVEWPGLTGPSILTVEGRIKQLAAVAENLAGTRGPRARTARLLLVALLVPPVTFVVMLIDICERTWRRIRRRRGERP